ncbi:MAG: hypothetical protein H0X25_18110 [Acidobacteriales bacterium]|nr:hypothetical protein [Terriglobales bacterium]
MATTEPGRSPARRRLLAIVLGVCGFLAVDCHAQTFAVLHSFEGGTDGITPYAGVVRDPDGNLYGMTYTGGATNHWGVLYKISSAGQETVLHTMTGHSGGNSFASLYIDSAGNLYGTASGGGPTRGGTVFELKKSGGQLFVLHSFRVNGLPDALDADSSLISDPEGNLYGSSMTGGDYGVGAVYSLNPKTGAEALIYSFTGGSDGAFPSGGKLVRDSAGNLYSATSSGGAAGYGAVYKLDMSGAETVLYSFQNVDDGRSPNGRLAIDEEGNLYGTAALGGTRGDGTIFKIDPVGNETTLHTFVGNDGQFPIDGVVRDSAGNVYGTANEGGSSGAGVVFKLDSGDTFSVLHNFSGPDGAGPYAAPIGDGKGNLYGTTTGGGTSPCGCGVVYKLVL